MDRKLLILGNRLFAEAVADVAREIIGWEVAGYVENWDRARCGERLDDLPIHWLEELAGRAGEFAVVGGLGTTQRRDYFARAAELGLQFATLVHPRAHVSPSTTIGAGSVIFPGVMIAAKSRLGGNVVVNRGALIGHHTEIGDCCTIGPGANIAGRCRIGEQVYVAMSAVIVDGITIGDGAVIGAGAVVVKDVPARTQVMGVPARVVKEGIEPK